MIAKPWVLDAKTLNRIGKLPAAQRQAGFISYRRFHYNSYKVPCISAFVLYGLFLLLILTAGANKLLAWRYPVFHAKLKQRLRLLRAYVFEHPLITRKHSSVVAFPFLEWITLQLPLRGEAIVLLALSLINFLPLVTFYDLLPGNVNTIYPGPHSKRDQISRHLADRTAILGVAQLPLLILMASKRTPLAIMSGLDMNSLMLYHRWIARWFWLHITIHAAAFTAIYVRNGGVAVMLEDEYVKWGVVALSMMFGLVFLSLRVLRQRFYEVFVMLHIAMAFFAMLGTYLHIALIKSPRFEMFKVMTEIAAAMWGFDRATRFVTRIYLSFSLPLLSSDKAKRTKALVQCATGEICSIGSNPNYTQLRISVPASKLRLPHQHKLLGGIAAGDDIRITIPRLQWVGEHPFTVFAIGTQPDDPSQGHIDLIVKMEAGLTRKLARCTSSVKNKGEEKDVEQASVQVKGGKVCVLIEGPFGIIPSIEEATDLVLVSGGVGITFCWPLLMAAARSSSTTKLSSCKLIWIIREYSTLALLKEAAEALTKEMERQQGIERCRISIDVYVTSHQGSKQGVPGTAIQPDDTIPPFPSSRTSSSNSIKKSAFGSSTPSSELTSPIVELQKLPHQREATTEGTGETRLFSDLTKGNDIEISLHGGRPDVLATALFSHLKEQELRDERGLTIGMCGPPSLCDDVRVEAVQMMKKGIHVELLEDCFTW